jgi:ribose 1,5-bisphosphokinase PhnN
MITITEKGNFNNTERYLRRLKSDQLSAILNRYGSLGVNALSNATPRETGETAASWYYTTVSRKGYYSIRWHNHHVEDGVPIAVILQYGHGTGTGGYVQGRDYIMPAIRPIFDQIAAEAWREVTKV